MSGQLGFFDAGADLLSLRDYGRFKSALVASGCERCGLAAGRTKIVVDRGNPNAGIMAVGEGPGADEDASGLAFVGRGGQLFDRLMAEAGFDTNADLLIANVVKCRPPENRVPKASEAKTCLPFLHHQISLVGPKVVILLGATALKYLLPNRKGEKMRDLVGRPFTEPEWPGIEFLVFYHPAYLLRDPRKQPDARKHIEVLRKLEGRS